MDSIYNDFGSLIAEELQNKGVKQDIKLQLQELFKNEQEQSPEIIELKKYLEELRKMTKKNIFDEYLSLRAKQYYNELNNKELIVFKNNKKSLNEAHELVLKIRDLFGRKLNISNNIVIYKEVDGKIKRVMRENLGDDWLNNSRSKRNARIGLTQKQIEALQEFNELEELFSQHYFDFKKTIDNKKNVWPSYNQGHIAEAFEGHFQHDEKGVMQKTYHNFQSKKYKQDAYIHFYYAIRNKDIWFTGGDIGDIQVKYMDAKHSSISMGSKLSLREIITFLLNFFDELLSEKNIDSINFDEKAEKIINIFFAPSEISEDLSNTASGKALQELLGIVSNEKINLSTYLKF